MDPPTIVASLTLLVIAALIGFGYLRGRTLLAVRVVGAALLLNYVLGWLLKWVENSRWGLGIDRLYIQAPALCVLLFFCFMAVSDNSEEF